MPIKRKHDGQLPLGDVEQGLEDEILRTDRPAGMPPYSAIRAEVLKAGLLEKDAKYINDVWLMNGFTLRHGKKIRDWKAAIRVWREHEYFPSQKEIGRYKAPNNSDRMRAQMDRMMENNNVTRKRRNG